MKFKALKNKKTGEFVSIDVDGLVFTHEFPVLQPITATLEEMIKYFDELDIVVDGLNCDDYELVTLECHEISE